MVRQCGIEREGEKEGERGDEERERERERERESLIVWDIPT